MEQSKEITLEDVEGNKGKGKVVLTVLFLFSATIGLSIFIVSMPPAMKVLLLGMLSLNIATFIYVMLAVAGVFSLIKKNTEHIGDLLTHTQQLYASLNSVGTYVQALGTKQHDLERAMGEECIYAKPHGMFNIDNTGGNDGGTPLQ